jgi:hypothetical protein
MLPEGQKLSMPRGNIRTRWGIPQNIHLVGASRSGGVPIAAEFRRQESGERSSKEAPNYKHQTCSEPDEPITNKFQIPSFK